MTDPLNSLSQDDVETYFEDGLWKNRIEANVRASNVHENKAAAVHAGRQMAEGRRSEHIIRDIDGTISHRNHYGPDPRNTS